MSRPIRIQYPGALYHIIARGNGGQNIYKDRKDYQIFLEVFFDIIKRFNWICYSYCLMPNHYHLLIETLDPNLSAGMRQLNGDYSQKFNIRYSRFGHLFQGRFKSVLVEKDIYLYRVIRYIVLNPVKAKLVRTPLDWKWSSYGETIGKKPSTKCVDVVRILKHFDSKSKEKARIALAKYVYQKIEHEFLWDELKGGVILGSDSFIDKIKDLFDNDKLEIEIPKKERFADRPELLKCFEDCKISDKKQRNELIYKAYNEYGYSLSEIGRHLGLHYSAISKIIKKIN